MVMKNNMLFLLEMVLKALVRRLSLWYNFASKGGTGMTEVLMKKCLWMLVMLVFCSARAETYTVTADSGTFGSPVSLDTLTVTDSALSTMSFAEAAGRFSEGDIFVKAGSGYVLASDGMSRLMGGTSEIRITEGCFIMAKNGHLGSAVDSSNKSGTSPKVVISDGATLALKTSAKCQIHNVVVLQGEGIDGLGAFCHASSIDQNDYLTYGRWSFREDTLITTKTATRFDMKSDFAIASHVVTFRANGAAGQVGVYGTWMIPGDTGKIVFDGVVVVDIGAKWNGSAANTVVVTNGAIWRMNASTAKPAWSLVWNSSSSMMLNGTVDGRWGGDSSVNGWMGPVRIDSEFFGVYGSTANCGIWLDGDVSGDGGIFSNCAWLHLRGANNAYRGLTVVRGAASKPAGLGLYSPGSIALASAGIVMTNAPVNMATAGVYALPRTTFHVDVGRKESISGASGGTIASLVKSGDGELVVLSPVAVTGAVELVQGTLTLAPPSAQTLYSAAPGMWEGTIAGTSTMDYGNKTANQTTVVSRPEMLFTHAKPPWENNLTATYSGYLWNRSPTNETWTFAASVAGYMRFYFNTGSGDVVFSCDDMSKVHQQSYTVAPGAHPFVLKVNPRTQGNPGSYVPKETSWSDQGYGFAMRRGGYTSNNYAKFNLLQNEAYGTLPGGDGFLLTRDSRDVGDFHEYELANLRRAGQSISNCVVHAGTVLDLGCTNGVSATVGFDLFVGANVITNGSVRFNGEWRLVAAERSSWPLRVTNGDVTFADGAELTIDDERAFRGAVDHDILTVSGAIHGFPSLSARLSSVGVLRLKPGDPRTLQFVRNVRGTVLLFR